MKRIYWEIILFVLTLVSVISFVMTCFLLCLVINREALAEDFHFLIFFVILFFISSYFAGYLYWEKKLDWEPVELCFWEWPFWLFELLGYFLMYHVYLYVKYLRIKNTGRLITYREYWRERKAEWEAFQQEKRKS